jgi:putative FmdB family regulatory protein
MPIYEYQCQKCGETTEIMQKFSEAPLRKCPACGGRVAKLMSMNSFQLKGSGWYVTDYTGRKNEAAPKEAAAEAVQEAKTAPETPKEPPKAAGSAKAKAKKEAPAKA